VQQTFCGSAKSIAGAVLAGVGIFIFYENLHRAATQLRHLLGTIPAEALGVLPAVILAAPRVLQAYAADHQRFVEGLLQQMLLSCWPLLLVMVGTVLSRKACADRVNTLPKRDCGSVDLTAGRSTLE
jgi:hypothetical protein